MKPLDLLKLSTRMFRTRPSRTFLTILGVSVGIGTILFLVSLGYGLQRLILAQITTTESLLSIDISPSNEDLIPLTQARIDSITDLPEIEEMSPLVMVPSQIALADLASDTTVYGVKPSYFRLGGITADQGALFSEPNAKEVVLSSALAKSFGLTEEDVQGKEVTFSLFISKEASPVENGEEQNTIRGEIEVLPLQYPYRIVGVIEDDFTSFAYFPLKSLELEGVPLSVYSQAKAKVISAGDIEVVREKIINMGFLVSALAETIEETNKVFQVIQIVLAIFGLIALMVSAIGMANTMTVTLLERTNEIGIMKAIGASERDIGLMFLTESVVMGFLGGLGGILIGFLGTEIFNFILNVVATGLGGQKLDIFYTPIWFIAFVLIFSTLVGLLTGLFPARRAARINPLKALQYK